eukprot:4813912-Prymnesium_polylepis.1
MPAPRSRCAHPLISSFTAVARATHVAEGARTKLRVRSVAHTTHTWPQRVTRQPSADALTCDPGLVAVTVCSETSCRRAS